MLASLLIRNVDPVLHARPQGARGRQGRSMEEEARGSCATASPPSRSSGPTLVAADLRALFEPQARRRVANPAA